MKYKVGEIYILGQDSFYKGERFLLDWISPNKNIFTAGRRMTMAHGKLLKNNKKINAILEFLIDEVDYSKISKFTLIKLVKSGDRRAKMEFIKRFKKKPKF